MRSRVFVMGFVGNLSDILVVLIASSESNRVAQQVVISANPTRDFPVAEVETITRA